MRSPRLVAVWAVWMAVVVGGMGLMWEHQNRPAKSGEAPVRWPEESQLHIEDGLPTLVMAAHPKCPCVHASLEELSDLLSRSPRRVSTYVLFFRPADQTDDWSQTAAWRQAQAIPGVVVAVDTDGREVQRLGCEVSGDAVLYSPSGELQFHGGITASRGEAGDNTSVSALRGVLAAQGPEVVRTPVFGCGLSSVSLNKPSFPR